MPVALGFGILDAVGMAILGVPVVVGDGEILGDVISEGMGEDGDGGRVWIGLAAGFDDWGGRD